MTVKVKLFAHFRDLFGGRVRDLDLPDGATAGDALAVLCDTAERRAGIFAGAGLKPHLVVMVNGVHVASLDGLATPLSPGDTLAVFPFLAGG